MNAPVTWTVTAVNAPEHAGNRIHTDDGAREQGFPAALVAGVTTYAYLTRPLVDAWGVDWLRGGGGEVRFRSPVFAGDVVACEPTSTAEGAMVEARCRDRSEDPAVTFDASRRVDGVPSRRDGENLPDDEVELVDRLGPRYGMRVDEDLDLYAREGIVHPAVWLAIANDVFSAELVRGSWIHTRSRVHHHGVGAEGDVVRVRSTVVDRFHRRGERAVADIRIERDGDPLVTIDHEAIIDLAA